MHSATRTPPTPFVKKHVFLFLFLIITPLMFSTANYLVGDRRGNWQTADRSSAGLLPKAGENPDALIRVYAARTVRWRGIFAVHTWIVVKEGGAPRYSRIDYTAWGEPIRIDGFAADGRWFEPVISVGPNDTEAVASGIGRNRSRLIFDRIPLVNCRHPHVLGGSLGDIASEFRQLCATHDQGLCHQSTQLFLNPPPIGNIPVFGTPKAETRFDRHWVNQIRNDWK